MDPENRDSGREELLGKLFKSVKRDWSRIRRLQDESRLVSQLCRHLAIRWPADEEKTLYRFQQIYPQKVYLVGSDFVLDSKRKDLLLLMLNPGSSKLVQYWKECRQVVPAYHAFYGVVCRLYRKPDRFFVMWNVGNFADSRSAGLYFRFDRQLFCLEPLLELLERLNR